MKEKLVILDGYSIIYRSYFAHMKSPMRNRNGENISSYYGFFSTLLSIMEKNKSTYIAVCFDEKGPTFRHEMYPAYKATREKAPEDLHAQIPLIKEALSEAGLTSLSKEGFEADDIIASLVRQALEENISVMIVTSDKDIMQLVTEGVNVLRPKDKDYITVDREGVKEIYGVYPEQIVDYLSILGDASDNIPGIKGIGEKGASSLLAEYGSLDEIYQNLDKLTPSQKKKMEDGRESAALSKSLIVLRDDAVKVSFPSLLKSKVNFNNLRDNFLKNDSPSLAKRVKKDEEEEKEEGEVLTIESRKEAEEIFKSRKGQTLYITKTEYGYSVSFDEGDVYLLKEGDIDVLSLFPLSIVCYDFKSIFKDLLAKNVKDAKCAFDVSLAAWLLESEEQNLTLERIANKYLGRKSGEGGEAKDVKSLYPVMENLLKERSLYSLLLSMEIPLSKVLAKMEMRGIYISAEIMEKLKEESGRIIKEKEENIYLLSGKTFNINSPLQLSKVLFEDLRLKPGKKTKSGYSTDTETLEELRKDGGKIIEEILVYRQLAKLKGTYIDPLPEMVDRNSRIHTTFSQTGTATGRLSSRNPNLQNIPVRTKEGRMIRGAFLAQKGSVFLSADYSQIELVVLASLSADDDLVNAFLKGEDVHRATASLIFEKEKDDVTDDERRIAKTINFGIIYGMSAHRLSNELGIARSEAQSFIDTYFSRYAKVKIFIENVYKKAREEEKVKTLFGHERKVLGINSRNFTERSAAERIAVNTIIQGTAAEIMKKAMIEIDKAIEERGLSSALLLQVHDELIFEVKDGEEEIMRDLVKEKMESAVLLSVPLKVQIESAVSWGDIH